MPDHLIVPPPPGAGHYPTAWELWQEAKNRSEAPFTYGFTTYGDVNRFGARYRTAHAFSGLLLVGYSTESVDGYASLFRVFLAWAAFDQYLRALAQSPEVAREWYGPLFPDDLVETIRAADHASRFFEFVKRHTRKRVKEALTAYVEGRQVCPTFLAAGIRHVFAHGILTPHANGADPVAVKFISDRLTEALLAAVDRDFARRMHPRRHGSASSEP